MKSHRKKKRNTAATTVPTLDESSTFINCAPYGDAFTAHFWFRWLPPLPPSQPTQHQYRPSSEKENQINEYRSGALMCYWLAASSTRLSIGSAVGSGSDCVSVCVCVHSSFVSLRFNRNSLVRFTFWFACDVCSAHMEIKWAERWLPGRMATVNTMHRAHTLTHSHV